MGAQKIEVRTSIKRSLVKIWLFRYHYGRYLLNNRHFIDTSLCQSKLLRPIQLIHLSNCCYCDIHWKSEHVPLSITPISTTCSILNIHISNEKYRRKKVFFIILTPSISLSSALRPLLIIDLLNYTLIIHYTKYGLSESRFPSNFDRSKSLFNWSIASSRYSVHRKLKRLMEVSPIRFVFLALSKSVVAKRI